MTHVLLRRRRVCDPKCGSTGQVLVAVPLLESKKRAVLFIYFFNIFFSYHTGGANSKNICFGRTAKFIRESEDIAGNREPREIIRETANNIRNTT